MINLLLQEGKKYLESSEYANSLNAMANEFALTEDEIGYLSVAIHDVVSGTIPEESFAKELKDLSDIKRDKIEKIHAEAKEKIFVPFRKHLENVLKSAPSVPDQPKPAGTAGISTLRQSFSSQAFSSPAPVAQPQPQQPRPQPAPRVPEAMPTKAALISEIENPPRTVIKRYVLEHEPITDPEHLIDDSVDERPRLEA